MNTLWGWGRASWAGCGPDVRRGGQTLIMGYSADKSPLIGHLAGPLRRLEPLGAQRQEKCGPNRPTPTGYSCNNAAMIRKRLADDTGGGAGHARQRDIDAAVRQVIGGAIDADEVIDLFAVAGLSEARLDILSDEFLGRVAALEQKNLALETLRKLLNDQIRITERTNIVQSRKFREALEDAMLRYTTRRSPPPR